MPFTVKQPLTVEQANEIFEILFSDMMAEIAIQLNLSDAEKEKHFPRGLDLETIMIEASGFSSDGRPSEKLAKLRGLIEQSGMVEEISDANEAMGAKRLKKRDRMRIAEILYKDGSTVLQSLDERIYLLLIRPDHLPEAQEHLEHLTRLPVQHLAPSQMSATAMQNMHLLRQIGDQAHMTAMKLVELAMPALTDGHPDAERRKEEIEMMMSQDAARILKATRCHDALGELEKRAGKEAAQQYRDMLLLRALMYGDDFYSVFGKPLYFPSLGFQRLRSGVAIHAHGLQHTNDDAALIAQFISMHKKKDGRDEAIKMIGKPVKQLLEQGLTEELAVVLARHEPAYAERKDVRAYMDVLKGARAMDTLADMEHIVPHMFSYLDKQVERAQYSAELRVELLKLYKGKATRRVHAAIERMENLLGNRVIINTYSIVMAECYLEAAQRLMPRLFPSLAPVRGVTTDRRLQGIQAMLPTVGRAYIRRLHS